jgi:hypothetical protein
MMSGFDVDDDAFGSRELNYEEYYVLECDAV